MSTVSEHDLVELVRPAARPLEGTDTDFDSVLDMVGDARVVLIGEASHGTHEFYRVRAEITKRLIRERGFCAIAAEADWPDAYRVNRYVRKRGDDEDAADALGGFERFPRWMWRNADMLDFVGWLRNWNEQHDEVGFYGLDLYSLHRSAEAVLRYLRVVDPAAAVRAKARYSCFEHFEAEAQSYGYAAALGLTPSCEKAVLAQLAELQRSAAEYASRDGRIAADDQFFAEQNARLVVDAEKYYRSMFAGRDASWNRRDQHMSDVLTEVERYLGRTRNRPAKIAVWAHNSHVGDARATQMNRRGELNIGQLAREHFGRDAVSIGFTTFNGTVTAASDWDEPPQRKHVRDALPGSWERLFHDLGGGGNWSIDSRAVLRSRPELPALLERAIGVIYRPQTERASHYFDADLPHQFDAVLHYDRTRAVEPLERNSVWERGELPDTYPSSL